MRYLAVILLLWATPVGAMTFAVIGDYGNGSAGESDVARLVASWSPEFILTLGDNNYPNGAADTIDVNIGRDYHGFIAPYSGRFGSGADTNRFFPSLGNHDWNTGTVDPYRAYFTLPGNERYYDFVRGPVHFYALDSDPREPDGTSPDSIQGRWLQERLAASTETFKIVYFHHPPYSSSSNHGSSVWMQWPFKTWGASVVLSGHDHTYERIEDPNNGLLYLVNGVGGAARYRFQKTPIPGSRKRFNADYGALRGIVDNENLTFEFISRSGARVDRCSIPAH